MPYERKKVKKVRREPRRSYNPETGKYVTEYISVAYYVDEDVWVQPGVTYASGYPSADRGYKA